jgi:hypothetical protein
MSEQKQAPGYIHLSNVRLSYFYGFEPFTPQPTQQNPNPKPVYCLHALMDPKHPDLPRVAALIQKVAEAEWKEETSVILPALKAKDDICLHKGDVTKAGKPEYAGLYFVSANNKKPFTIVDGDRTPLRAKDGRPYSGCYANVILDIWAQNNQFGKRVNATATGVQFLRHAEAFGGGAPAADPNEFGNVVAAASADAPAPSGDPVADLLG